MIVLQSKTIQGRLFKKSNLTFDVVVTRHQGLIDYLKEVSKDRVVVIVTHDEDLAHKYASRIISLEDGKVLSDTGNNLESKMQSKTLDFKRPKMKFGMMFKFAKNNVFSRMFRSIATAAVVSIGYVAIMLLSFMIFGINNSITDTISSFVPEDVYNVYEIQSVDITEDKLDEVSQLEHVDNARYDVSEYLSFKSAANVEYSGLLAPLAYDEELFIENSTMVGTLPQNDGEILINITTAVNLVDGNLSGEYDLDYYFTLVGGTDILLYTETPNDFGEYTTTVVDTYKIVGVVSPSSVNAGVNFFLPYNWLRSLTSFFLKSVRSFFFIFIPLIYST